MPWCADSLADGVNRKHAEVSVGARLQLLSSTGPKPAIRTFRNKKSVLSTDSPDKLPVVWCEVGSAHADVVLRFVDHIVPSDAAMREEVEAQRTFLKKCHANNPLTNVPRGLFPLEPLTFPAYTTGSRYPKQRTSRRLPVAAVVASQAYGDGDGGMDVADAPSPPSVAGENVSSDGKDADEDNDEDNDEDVDVDDENAVDESGDVGGDSDGAGSAGWQSPQNSSSSVMFRGRPGYGPVEGGEDDTPEDQDERGLLSTVTPHGGDWLASPTAERLEALPPPRTQSSGEDDDFKSARNDGSDEDAWLVYTTPAKPAAKPDESRISGTIVQLLKEEARKAASSAVAGKIDPVPPPLPPRQKSGSSKSLGRKAFDSKEGVKVPASAPPAPAVAARFSVPFVPLPWCDRILPLLPSYVLHLRNVGAPCAVRRQAMEEWTRMQDPSLLVRGFGFASSVLPDILAVDVSSSGAGGDEAGHDRWFETPYLDVDAPPAFKVQPIAHHNCHSGVYIDVGPSACVQGSPAVLEIASWMVEDYYSRCVFLCAPLACPADACVCA